MKPGTKILIGVAVALVAVGSILAGIGYLVGQKNADERVRMLEKNRQKDVLNIDAFENIDLISSYADIQWVASDHFAVEYDVWSRTKAPSIEVQNKTLKIRFAQQHVFSGVNFFELPFFWGDGDYAKGSNTITIYYPEGTNFTNVKLDSDFGNIDMQQLYMKTLNVNLSYGEMNVDELIVEEEADFDNSFSDCKGKEVAFGSLYTRLSYGSFRMERVKVEEGVDSDGSFCDIMFSGELLGKNIIKQSYGSVSLELAAAESEYDINTNAEFADVMVNGNNFGTRFSREGGPNSLGLTADFADISLNFSSVRAGKALREKNAKETPRVPSVETAEPKDAAEDQAA